MVRKWFSLTLVCAVACLIPNCGHEQQLTDISIQPAVETFGSTTTPVSANTGSTVQLRALGSYIHPPVTKDITSQVTWASNTPQIATVSSTGLLTATGVDCGNSLVSATVTTNKSTGNISSSGALVTGYMTATVVCFTGSGGGGGGFSLTVTFQGNGAGTVTSSPPGINCANTSSPCTASFPSGTVTLTPTAIGSTFIGWLGCDSVSNQVCTVNLIRNTAVVVTFN
jgi:hypothetical protein